MPESSRRPFGSQRIDEYQTLLKSAGKHFYPNFTLIQETLSWKISPLVRSEILELFVITLTEGHIYSHHN